MHEELPQDRLRLKLNPTNVSVPEGHVDLYFFPTGQLVAEFYGGVVVAIGSLGGGDGGGENLVLTNEIINAVIDDNPAATRAAGQMVGLVGNDSISGTKTFTGQVELSGQILQSPNSALNAALADMRYVGLTGEQIVSGSKTFSALLRATNQSLSDPAAVLTVALADGAFVHKTGAETIAGEKTFTELLKASNQYGGSIDTVLTIGLGNSYYTMRDADETIDGNWTFLRQLEAPNTMPNGPASVVTLWMADSMYVSLTADQEIAGAKTFTGPLEAPNQSASTDASVMTRALSDARYVSLTTNQSVAGNKTFTGQLEAPNQAALGDNSLLTLKLANGHFDARYVDLTTAQLVGGDKTFSGQLEAISQQPLTNASLITLGYLAANYVDKSTNQAVGGAKTFLGQIQIPNQVASSPADVLTLGLANGLFVDLVSNQTVGGKKTFSGQMQATGQTLVDGNSVLTKSLADALYSGAPGGGAFVDTTTDQTIGGKKTFTEQMELTGQSASGPNSAMTRALSDQRYIDLASTQMVGGAKTFTSLMKASAQDLSHATNVLTLGLGDARYLTPEAGNDIYVTLDGDQWIHGTKTFLDQIEAPYQQRLGGDSVLTVGMAEGDFVTLYSDQTVAGNKDFIGQVRGYAQDTSVGENLLTVILGDQRYVDLSTDQTIYGVKTFANQLEASNQLYNSNWSVLTVGLANSLFVNLSSDQTVLGKKTFGSLMQATAQTTAAANNVLTVGLADGRYLTPGAGDGKYVDLTTNQTVGGIKTFTANMRIDGNLGMGNAPSSAWKIEATGATEAGAKFNSGTRFISVGCYSADLCYINSKGAHLRIGTSDAFAAQFYTNGTVRGSCGSTGLWNFSNASTGVNTHVEWTTGATNERGLVIRGIAGQTATMMEMQDSTGAVTMAVNAAGYIGVGLFNPAVPLHLVTAAAHTAMRIDAASGFSSIIQLWNSGAAKVQLGYNYALGGYQVINAGSSVSEFFIDSTGKVGMGIHASLGAKLHVVSTTQQLRLGYDAANYITATVGATGGVTFANAGSAADPFTFTGNVVATGANSRMPNQTLATTDSVMTRWLADNRYVDLTNNQTVGGNKIFNGQLEAPNQVQATNNSLMTLAMANGNYVDLFTNQTVGGAKTFNGQIKMPNQVSIANSDVLTVGNAKIDFVTIDTTQIITGKKTFTQQLQATGQAIVDGDSVLTVALADGRYTGGSGEGQYVDLTTDQTIGGKKVFTEEVRGGIAVSMDAYVTLDQFQLISNGTYVKKNGDETINGSKWFTGLMVATGQTTASANNVLTVGLADGRYLTPGAGDGKYVDLVNAQTVGGVKTFSNDMRINGTIGVGTAAVSTYSLMASNATQAGARFDSGTRRIEVMSYAADNNFVLSRGATLRIGTFDNQTVYFLSNNTPRGFLTDTGKWVLGPTILFSGARVEWQTTAVSEKGLVIRGMAGQTANLIDLQSDTGSNVLSISPTGHIGIGNAPGSLTLEGTDSSAAGARFNSGTRKIEFFSFATSDNFLYGRGAPLNIGTGDANYLNFRTNDIVRGGVSDTGKWCFSPVSFYTGARVEWTMTAANERGLIIRSFTGQTANLVELQDSAGVNMVTIGPSGNFVSTGTANRLPNQTAAAADHVLTVGLADGRYNLVGSAPSLHASTHATGGSDPITPASIGAMTQATADGRYVGLTGNQTVSGIKTFSGGLVATNQDQFNINHVVTFWLGDQRYCGTVGDQSIGGAKTFSGLMVATAQTAASANNVLTVGLGDARYTTAAASDAKYVNLTTDQTVGGKKTFGSLMQATAQTVANMNNVLTVGLGDVRYSLTNSPPTAHASTHATGGSDPITPASIGALSMAQAQGEFVSLWDDNLGIEGAKTFMGQMELPNQQIFGGGSALTAYLASQYFVSLYDDQNVDGSKTFNGQMELNGQSLVDDNSAMTLGLSDSRYLRPAAGDTRYAPFTITDANLPAGIITNAKLAADAVTTTKILDGAVSNTKILDGAVSPNKIATDAVTTTKILNLAVTTGKIADLAVTAAKIANKTITAAEIADNTITALQLATDSVGSAEIQALSVTGPCIADDAVTSSKIAQGAVNKINIAANTNIPIQYVTQVKDTAETIAGTGGWVDVAALGKAITRIRTAGVMWVDVKIYVSTGGSTPVAVRVVRNFPNATTVVGVGNAGSSARTECGGVGGANLGNANMELVAFSFIDGTLDTDTTELVVQYRVQVRLPTGSNVWVNRGPVDTDSNVFFRPISTLTLVELA